jgi:hypothetical protein
MAARIPAGGKHESQLAGVGNPTPAGIAARRYKKPANTRVAPREMIKDIADNCQAVTIALSD